MEKVQPFKKLCRDNSIAIGEKKRKKGKNSEVALYLRQQFTPKQL